MNKLSIQQNTTQNTSTQSTENTKKETSWLSKNIHFVCGAALLAISLPILWKLGAAAQSTSPQQHSWIPLTEAEQAPVKDFDLEGHVTDPSKNDVYAFVIHHMNSNKNFLTDLKTLFQFCVNTNPGKISDKTLLMYCANESAASLIAYPKFLPGFLFQELRFQDGNWLKKV